MDLIHPNDLDFVLPGEEGMYKQNYRHWLSTSYHMFYNQAIHLEKDKNSRLHTALSTLEILADGRIRLHEEWRWTNGRPIGWKIDYWRDRINDIKSMDGLKRNLELNIDHYGSYHSCLRDYIQR